MVYYFTIYFVFRIQSKLKFKAWYVLLSYNLYFDSLLDRSTLMHAKIMKSQDSHHSSLS